MRERSRAALSPEPRADFDRLAGMGNQTLERSFDVRKLLRWPGFTFPSSGSLELRQMSSYEYR
jgi:hypothetical protein